MREVTQRRPGERRATGSHEPVRRVATSAEERENQLIALAFDLVEDRLRNKTASAQETTHFLKLATEKERLERERLKNENELLKARKKSIESSDQLEALLGDAIRTFTSKYEWQGDDTGSEV